MSFEKTFTVYWKDGNREELVGISKMNAFAKAGYGASALLSVDFICEGIDNNYIWDDENSSWRKQAA